MSLLSFPHTQGLREKRVFLVSVLLRGSCEGIRVLVKASRKYGTVLRSHSIFSRHLDIWENMVNFLDFWNSGVNSVVLWCCLKPRFIPSCLCAGLPLARLSYWQYGCHRSKACTSWITRIHAGRGSEIFFFALSWVHKTSPAYCPPDSIGGWVTFSGPNYIKLDKQFLKPSLTWTTKYFPPLDIILYYFN